MQTATVVIEKPTTPIHLGMSMAGGRVITACVGSMAPEKEQAIRLMLEELRELRQTRASPDHFVFILSDKLTRLHGIAFGIYATGVTSDEEHLRLRELASNAFDMRFAELCHEHIPGYAVRPT